MLHIEPVVTTTCCARVISTVWTLGARRAAIGVLVQAAL